MHGNFKDITGLKFGRLTAVELVRMDDKRGGLWRYSCDCGGSVVRFHANVRHVIYCGSEARCDQCRRSRPSFPQVDLAGKKFGKLTAIRPVRSSRDGSGFIWEFRCDCGNVVERLGSRVSKEAMRKGQIPSCGIGECSRMVPYGQGRRMAINSYQAGARNRGIEFDLTEEQTEVLFLGNCYYCGMPPSLNRFGYVYNGIDRVDNARGYLIDNVVSCCPICNRAKKDMTKDEFIKWIDRLVSYRRVVSET
jgi:hypothetical protein